MCSSRLLVFSLLFLLMISVLSTDSAFKTFPQCFAFHTFNSQNILAPNSANYTSVLKSSIQNLRFSTPSTPKPQFIITPTQVFHVQAAVICCKQHDLQIRVRSGGHDYEGLSYVSKEPFIVIDLVNYRSIRVDTANNTAWVQAGATVGELYYRIAEKSITHGFPAGVCPTIGVGGHFSGGGISLMMRKYGLSIDNILDACLVDANGLFHTRDTISEDLFWAIRGGGGGNFGIIMEWKIKLVPVPPTVTVFTVSKSIEEGATDLVYQWQSIAPNLDKNLQIRVMLTSTTDKRNKTTIQAAFNSLFLGTVDELIPLMEKNFPKLGLKRDDCHPKRWIDTALYFEEYPPNSPLEVLLKRDPPFPRMLFKSKSDFVMKPIPKEGLEGLWDKMFEQNGLLILEPLGGRISEVSDSATPFPHRRGNLYTIQYFVTWDEGGAEGSQKYLDWIRDVYAYMKPFVSANPRGAYINYRDIDLGRNDQGYTSYSNTSFWGFSYYKNNLLRLAHTKATVDPYNIFRHEQSIPPFVEV